MEQTCAHPSFPHRAPTTQKVRQIWTPEEDRTLSNAVARETPHTGTISWHKVATHLPGRNNKDCRKRWSYSLAHTIRKGTWSKEEDAKLLDAVEKYGFRWSKVAKAVGSRNGDQVFKRWGDCLDPRIDKSPWTGAEDDRLLRQVALTGRNWSEMVNKHFPNRTALSAKNRYSILLRKQGAARQPRLTTPTSTVQSPSTSAIDDGSSTCTFAEYEMIPQQYQQPWITAPNNMPHTWYYSDGIPSGDILDLADVTSPFSAAGPGVDWTIDYPDGTPEFPATGYQLQLAQFSSPDVMSADLLSGVDFGERYRFDWSTERVEDGSQGMVVGIGDPGGEQGVGYSNPVWFVC